MRSAMIAMNATAQPGDDSVARICLGQRDIDFLAKVTRADQVRL